MDQPPNVAEAQCANKECQITFERKKFNQIYCSAKCRWAGWLERKIEESMKAKGTT